jgi:hypothetical protein
VTIVFRSHSLADLMTDPKAKGETLSQGAKTALRRIAKQFLFGIPSEAFSVSSKYTQKGLQMENSAIALLNTVRGSNYVKNTERRTNDWVSGEPDIVAENHGVDIKCSWSVDTFPLTAEEGEDKTYEWQARAYMMLFDRPRWEIAYCLVETPESLMAFEDWRLHKVSHIPAYKRVTIVTYERDAALEEKIKVKCDAAREYLNDLLVQLGRRHDAILDMNPNASGEVSPEPVAPKPRTQTAQQAFA